MGQLLQAGQPVLLGVKARLEEAQEGRDAYREKRRPDFGKFPKRP